MESWKIAKGLYIVPLIFAYTPMIGGDLYTVVHIGFFALFGMYAFAAVVQRHSEGPMAVWLFPVMIAGAALSFWPLELVANIAGAVIVSSVVFVTSRAAKRKAKS